MLLLLRLLSSLASRQGVQRYTKTESKVIKKNGIDWERDQQNSEASNESIIVKSSDRLGSL